MRVSMLGRQNGALSSFTCLYMYMGTSLMRNTLLLGLCSRTLPRVLCWSQGLSLVLMSEVPLYRG